MTADRTAFHIAAVLVSFAACICIPGCSGEEPGVADAVPAAPIVDPRYATADALLGDFNAMTAMDPADTNGVLLLVHTENDRQQELTNLAKQMQPAFPLESAMRRQFKESFDTRAPAFFGAGVRGPAAITNSQGERATATYKNEAGKPRTLQLVKYDNRWWISGLTFEQDPDFKGITRDDVEVMGIMLRALKPIASNLAQRVKVGEFKSAATARQAIQAAVLERVANNPGDVLRLSDIAAKNSKYAALGQAANAAGYKRSTGE